ncbi:unnamed protein product [[Candida] boidinii]|nr:unnamed protein product [[Candida] boidinii]
MKDGLFEAANEDAEEIPELDATPEFDNDDAAFTAASELLIISLKSAFFNSNRSYNFHAWMMTSIDITKIFCDDRSIIESLING